MDIKKELDDNQMCMLLMPSMEYTNTVADVIKSLEGKSICYVTLNKTFPSIDDAFKSKGIDTGSIVFIDAISKTIMSKPDQVDRCYYVSSPTALTELSIAISKFLRHNFDYLILDSITNLLVLNQNSPTIVSFLSTISNKIRASKTKAVFYALDIAEHKSLLDECGLSVDKIIKIKEAAPQRKKNAAKVSSTAPQPNF